jgi:hypothetical protein
MTDREPGVVLCLLALRKLGGRSVPASGDLFKKGLKKELEKAIAAGWIQQNKVATLTKKGTPTKKQMDVLDLTEQGEAVLRESASQDDLAVTAPKELARFRERLEADRQELLREVLATATPKGKKADSSPQKEVAALSKAVSALSEKLKALEARLEAMPENPAAKFDEAFDRFLAKLQSVLPSHSTPQHATGTTLPLRAVLRQAYEKLCRFIEFESGLVEIPRLYYEARVLQPGLTLDAFHRELESLWSQRVLELRVLNEVRTASEPEKGIRRGDNLYYFVYWKSP